MADSLSRWAEALREISARLQQMPGEEGYPTYLSSRLGMLYERAGRVTALGTPSRTGAITFISAVSPPGGDFSEPVTQASLRVARAMWALDPSLANQRQFPAVDWETSYSLDAADVTPWFAEHAGSDWADLRGETLQLLQREVELREIAGLVGPDALEDPDRLVLETARLIRELIIGQSAFDPVDAFCPIAKTYGLASLAIAFHRRAAQAVQQGVPLEQIDVAAVRRAAVALRSAREDEIGSKVLAAETVLEAAIPKGAV
jgi:V/A-type H+-transporting ATPase subunit A